MSIECLPFVHDRLSENWATRTARPCGTLVAGPIDCKVTPEARMPVNVMFVNALSISDVSGMQPLSKSFEVVVQPPNVTPSFCHAALNSLTMRLLIWRVYVPFRLRLLNGTSPKKPFDCELEPTSCDCW